MQTFEPNRYPVSDHFTVALRLGMKPGLQGRTRAQRKGKFKDNLNILDPPNKKKLSSTTFQVQ